MVEKYGYIIEGKNKNYFIKEVKDWDDFWKNFEEKYEYAYGASSLWEHDRTANGFYYSYELCPQGMLATIYKFPEDTDAEVKKAEAQLRFTNDVVLLKIAKVNHILEGDELCLKS
jgi:hypothetical protein